MHLRFSRPDPMIAEFLSMAVAEWLRGMYGRAELNFGHLAAVKGARPAAGLACLPPLLQALQGDISGCGCYACVVVVDKTCCQSYCC